MKTIILEPLLHLILVLPFLLFFLKSKNREALIIVAAFSIYFLLNAFIVHLPLEFKQLDFIDGNWNWSGKILGVLGSYIFLISFKKFDLENYYLTLKQEKKFLKTGIIVVTILLTIQIFQGLFTGSVQEWSLETFLFQLTMPGIQEEVAFRGIMLGLLVKILKPTSNIIFHPALIITSVLFGMAHGLVLNDSLIPSFRIFPFVNTFVLGMIWGWLTMKSGSIILALISHNLGNVAQYLLRIK